MEWVGSRSCAVFVNAQKSDFFLPEQNKLRIESEIDASSDSSRTVRSPLGDGLRERHWYIWAGNWSKPHFHASVSKAGPAALADLIPAAFVFAMLPMYPQNLEKNKSRLQSRRMVRRLTVH